MKIYTVYDKPTDYPEEYVVRVYRIINGEVVADKELFMRNKNINDLYREMAKLKLAFLPPDADDDKKIIGIYI